MLSVEAQELKGWNLRKEMIKIPIAILLTFIFLSLSCLHIYWGLGGRRGLSASVPRKPNGAKRINPSSFDCFIVAVLLLAAGLFVLVRSRILLFSPWSRMDSASGFLDI